MVNLKKLRLERKLSQQKLAEKFGITQQAIYNYENDISEPDIYMLKQFADFFHTSVDYIIGYTDNPLPHENTDTLQMKAVPTKELHHLAMYRKLPMRMRDRLDDFLDEFFETENF